MTSTPSLDPKPTGPQPINGYATGLDWIRALIANVARDGTPGTVTPALLDGLVDVVRWFGEDGLWTTEWPDPSQHQVPGFPRTISLGGWLAVHAPLDVWRTAWGQGWTQAHRANDDPHDEERGALTDQFQAEDLLRILRAVVHHPSGTPERFDALLDVWVALAQQHPQACQEAWVETFWRTRGRALSDAPPATASSPAVVEARLQWVNQWLDPQTHQRRDDPAGQDRAWTWVQRWLDHGHLTLEQLVHREYRWFGHDRNDHLPPAVGNGLQTAWRFGSVVAMEAWTRWERAWYGPSVIARQWRRALASLHPDNRHRPTQDLGERALNAAPGDGDDRKAAWIDWGVRRTQEGDPSALAQPMALPLYDEPRSAPTVTLGLWMASEPLHPSAIPPNQAPWLCRAAQAWERAELERAADQACRPADRARPRL